MEKMYCGLQRGKSGSIETRTKELKETGDDNLPWIWLLGLTSDPRRAVTVCVCGEEWRSSIMDYVWKGRVGN